MLILNLIKHPNIVYLAITFLIILCSLLVIVNKNPIHSILYLVLVFILTTILFLTLNVEFIAMLFLVLYIGAIVVLFLFVVMMLNVRIIELKERIISYVPIAIIIVLIFFLLVLSMLKVNFIIEPTRFTIDNINILEFFFKDILFSDSPSNINNIYTHNVNSNNLNLIAFALYKDYIVIFFLAGIILFIAMIGSITLTLNQKSITKRQDYYKQTNKDIVKAIRHLK
jgi:NADH:ubiquinone oxidoreductase subunit 6 (subunit J)